MLISIAGPELSKLSPDLVAQLAQVLPRLSNADPSIWGPAAQPEAATRLGWLTAPARGNEVLQQIRSLIPRQRTVLCGMGGSSLAPEVIAATYQRDLVVLDSTDPQQVQEALSHPEKTTFIIASKSGSTVETDSQRRAVEAALNDAGLPRREHIVVITDPNSPLDQYSREQNYPTINADPQVGGRFSALTAFGLTPAHLIGVDVDALLHDAIEATAQMTHDPSPAVLLAAAMVRHNTVSPYITIASAPDIPGFGDWVEQLVAESTGKEGRGILPIVVEDATTPDFRGSDRLSIALSPTPGADLVIQAPLAAHFVLWEWATALAGYALGIDPFNQPNVTESKTITGQLLDNGLPAPQPLFVEDGIEVFTDLDSDSLSDLFDQLRHHAGYLAVMAYLDRINDNALTQLRPLLGHSLPCTFGWGPRFLHSTGQFHKGGPLIGAFLQITGESTVDLAIPGQSFSFRTLQMAQALGDYQALESRGLPIVRLHLRNRKTGIDRLLRLAHAG